MTTKQEIIAEYTEFNRWVDSLNGLADDLWLKPIAQGKWSVAEIITHLMFWNRFILEERLPHIRPGAQLVSKVDAELKNSQASQYARSGIGKKELLDEWLVVGQRFVETLQNIPEEIYGAVCQINQKNSNLISYLQGMLQHDKHHQEQIESFLKEQ